MSRVPDLRVRALNGAALRRAPRAERPIFGKVGSMTSTSTRRKVRLACYLKAWGDGRVAPSSAAVTPAP